MKLGKLTKTIAALLLAACARGESPRDHQPITRQSSQDAVLTLVGALHGEAESDDSGQARYTIALDVPPGARGFAPSMQLVYASGAGNDVLGQGFFLSGLRSSISRCARTFLDDGAPSSPRFDATDAVCLDGERLLLFSGQNLLNGAVYRPRHDDFRRVVIEGDVGTTAGVFVVTERDGTVHRYGGVDRWEDTWNGKPYVWHRASSTDTFNNTIVYDYERTTDPADATTSLETRLNLVKYAQSGVSAQKIVLEYEDRTDVTKGYAFGAPFQRAKRLKNVTTWTSATKVREYRFEYKQAISSKRCSAR